MSQGLQRRFIGLRRTLTIEFTGMAVRRRSAFGLRNGWRLGDGVLFDLRLHHLWDARWTSSWSDVGVHRRRPGCRDRDAHIRRLEGALGPHRRQCETIRRTCAQRSRGSTLTPGGSIDNLVHPGKHEIGLFPCPCPIFRGSASIQRTATVSRSSDSLQGQPSGSAAAWSSPFRFRHRVAAEEFDVREAVPKARCGAPLTSNPSPASGEGHERNGDDHVQTRREDQPRCL